MSKSVRPAWGGGLHEALQLPQAKAPVMRVLGDGTTIYGSLIYSDAWLGGGAAYVASKAAIVGVTKHTALRFAGQGIRCNVVCPGSIATPMTAGMGADNMDADMFGQMAKHGDLRVPVCMPDDVANILLFLASDESKAITGQAIVSDFGSTL
jgi:NAD(P)-dependent dehydrogenase (short-subunit alcohol dehydrogenase family)